jgi:hypothetical protein
MTHILLSALTMLVVHGMEFSKDTVYDISMSPGCSWPCPSAHSATLRNTGTADLVLDSTVLGVDTSVVDAIALMFVGPARPGDCYAACRVSYNRFSGPSYYQNDYTNGRPGCQYVVPPGDSIVFDHFDIDLCFCLLKRLQTFQWSYGDTIALPLIFHAGADVDTLFVYGRYDAVSVSPSTGSPLAASPLSIQPASYNLDGRRLSTTGWPPFGCRGVVILCGDSRTHRRVLDGTSP